MKASVVFPKAAKKEGVRYLGMSRMWGNYLLGYFETESGDVIKIFFYPAIKDVSGGIRRNIEECTFVDNADEVQAYFRN